MNTLAAIDQFLGQKRLALAGASATRGRFGNVLLRELTRQGYALTLIHPRAESIDGVPCHRSLADLPAPVDGLVLCVPPPQTELLVREAAAAGIGRIWMQQGSESAAAVDFCREQGINVVHGECLLMFARPTGIHRVHRWLWGLLGKLPDAGPSHQPTPR